MAINSMDTRIERKSRFKKKHIYSLIGIAVGLLCLLWLLKTFHVPDNGILCAMLLRL